MFTTPYIAEWPVVLQRLTLKRIKKSRAADKARLVIQMKSFRRWQHAKQKVTFPEFADLTIKAEAHFVQRLGLKVLYAWYDLSRERGKNIRKREKIFYIWRKWAKKEKDLNNRLVNCVFILLRGVYHYF